MADTTRQQPQDVAGSVEGLRHAFALLASAELGAWPAWSGPADKRSLRTRVELLTLLFDLVPRTELHQLDAVIKVWSRECPDNRRVSSAELRTAARKVLVQPSLCGHRQGVSGDNLRRALAILGVSVGSSGVGAKQSVDRTGRNDAAAAAQLCARGLATWFDQLDNNPRWTELPAVVRGDASIEIDKIYVELFAIADEEMAETSRLEVVNRGRLARRMLASEFPVVSATTMVARTLEHCIVLGEPGSGKSTLVQWLARAVFNKQCPDFDMALVVKLSAFAAALEKRPQQTLLGFFFETLENEEKNWDPSVHWLRTFAGETRRSLLLLDGWDEVPVAQRDSVWERIRQEQDHFVTVVTSRPAGLVGQLQGKGQGDLYHLAGLAPRASEDLVRNLLVASGQLDLLPAILKRITDEADLREMAANPFLLGLLVRIFVRTAAKGSSPRTLADVYRQVTAWVQQQHNRTASSNSSLTAEHLVGLRRLSHALLFEADPPRYLFHSQELAECLATTTTEPVFRSRFVHRVDPVFDEFVFLHATFQEFFAACHAASFSRVKLQRFLDRPIQSASRVIVLEFLSGLGGAAARECQSRAVAWLGDQDRFHQVLFRIARLAASGRWPGIDREGLGRAVRDELWRVIETAEDNALSRDAVRAFSELDASDLCRRAREANEVSTWTSICMLESLPAAITQRENLIELLPGAWQDFAGRELRSEVSPADVDTKRAMLQDPAATDEDRWEAIAFVGAVRDSESVPALLGVLDDDAVAARLREQTLDSLAMIGGRRAIDELIRSVTGERQLTLEGVRMAAAALRHSSGNKKALDPIGRDRLLRRLAVTRADEPYVEFMLIALEGYPIREGAAVIGELALAPEVPPEARSRAVEVLKTAADRRLVEQAVSSVEGELSNDVIASLLNLAVSRALPLPMPWLARKIQSCRSRVSLHRYLKAFVLALPHALETELEDAHAFLRRLVGKALTEEATDDESDLSKALLQVVSLAEGAVWRLSEESLELVRRILAEFAEAPERAPEGRVLLAASIAGRCRDMAARSVLRKSLEAALNLAGDSAGGHSRKPQRLALAIANALADIAPEELLPYPTDCEPVAATLRMRALQRGWLVFGTRIVDSEGNEVCRVGGPAPKPPELQRPADVGDILRVLKGRELQVFTSYWLMVEEGGPCQPGDSLLTIHETLRKLLDVADVGKRSRSDEFDERVAQRGDNFAESLNRFFRDDKLPKFDTWRRTLTRIRKRFEGKPESLRLFDRIGLGRRNAANHGS